MARGKGQQTSGGTKKEKKETRQERRARLEAEAAAREVSGTMVEVNGTCQMVDIYIHVSTSFKVRYLTQTMVLGFSYQMLLNYFSNPPRSLLRPTSQIKSTAE